IRPMKARATFNVVARYPWKQSLCIRPNAFTFVELLVVELPDPKRERLSLVSRVRSVDAEPKQGQEKQDAGHTSHSPGSIRQTPQAHLVCFCIFTADLRPQIYSASSCSQFAR